MGTQKLTGIIVSDTHIGSAFGIFPEGYIGSTGSEITLNVGQKYLLECWDWMLEKVPRKVDFLMINGDVVDGNKGGRMREGGRVEPDPDFQVSAAKMLFLRGNPPLLNRAKRIYVSRGSAYHVETGARLDEIFARENRCNTRPHGSLCIIVAYPILRRNRHRFSLIIVPRISDTNQPLGKGRCNFDRMIADLKGGSSDLIIRSHGHRYVKLNVDGDLFLATPAWSLQTDFAKMSKYPNRLLSRLIGGVRVRPTTLNYRNRGDSGQGGVCEDNRAA